MTTIPSSPGTIPLEFMIFDDDQYGNKQSYTRGTIASTFKKKYLVVENQDPQMS
jgi:hypothetical protein